MAAIGVPVLDQALISTGDASAVSTSTGGYFYFPDSVRGQYLEFIVYAEWSSGSAAGGVTIQTAHQANYTGTWANVGSAISWAANTSTNYAAVTGIFGALRVAITSAVTTGTVAIKVVASDKG